MNLEDFFEKRTEPVVGLEMQMGFESAGYLSVVEGYRLGEVSPDIVLYDIKEAKKDNILMQKDWPSLKGRYWKIGRSGQGDYWLLRSDGTICWFDHNVGEIDESRFVDIGIDFLN